MIIVIVVVAVDIFFRIIPSLRFVIACIITSLIYPVAPPMPPVITFIVTAAIYLLYYKVWYYIPAIMACQPAVFLASGIVVN